MLSMLLALVLNTQTVEAACPWASNEPVHATAIFGVVYVNGTPYRVRTAADAEEFEAILHECGASKAVDELSIWRAFRASYLTGAAIINRLPGVSAILILPSGILCVRSRVRIERDIRSSGDRIPDEDLAALEDFE